MGPTVFYVKGDRTRVAESIPPMSLVTIIDRSKRVMYIVDNSARTYAKLPLKDDAPADASGAATMAKPRKAGTAVVAGHPCTLYESSLTTGAITMRSEWCMAEDLGPLGLVALGPVGRLFGDSPFPELGSQGFPLQMRSYDGSGALLFSMEATRVEHKSEPDSLFEPPSGYAEVDAGIF
jgi:hypothetical protein